MRPVSGEGSEITRGFLVASLNSSFWQGFKAKKAGMTEEDRRKSSAFWFVVRKGVDRNAGELADLLSGRTQSVRTFPGNELPF